MLNPKNKSNAAGEMHLLEHLAELRTRLIYSFLGLSLASIVAYNYSTEVFAFLCQPYFQAFPNNQLIGTGPAEALMLKIKTAIFCGGILSSPFIFYQLWLFIAPGLYDNERKMVLPFVASTTGLFLLGAGFCYRYVIPLAFAFFQEEYKSIGVTPAVKISEHLSTMMQGLIGFGVVFQMPILAWFLARLGILNHRMMIEGGRYAVVIIFIVSAIFTPPDVLSQFLMAGPLCVLYAVSILIVKQAYRERPAASPEASSLPSDLSPR